MSRLSERDGGYGGNVGSVNVGDLAVARGRIDHAVIYDVFKLAKQVLHEVVGTKDGPIHT